MVHSLGSLLLLLQGCGGRSAFLEDDEAIPESGAAEGLPPGSDEPPAGGDPPGNVEETPVDPVGDRCAPGDELGFSISDPVLLEVSAQSVYLSSMAAGADGLVVVVENRRELTQQLIELSGTGDELRPERVEIDGIAGRVAWSEQAGAFALAYSSPGRDQVVLEVWTPVVNQASSWSSSELGVSTVPVVQIVGPVFAGEEWVVGWRTEEGITVRTESSLEGGGWQFVQELDSEIALAAEERSGITYVALHERDVPVRIVRLGTDGAPIGPDFQPQFDRPLESIAELASSTWEDHVFAQGTTAGGQSCLLRTPDEDFTSCITLAYEDGPTVALSSALVDAEVHEMAVSAVEHATPEQGWVIDLSWHVAALDGSSLLGGDRIDITDESTISWPDGSDMNTPPYGGVAIAPIQCGYLLAWGDQKATGSIATAVVRFNR